MLPGLEEIARQEAAERLPAAIVDTARNRPGRLAVRFSGELADLNALHSAVAAYRVLTVEATGPRALLGHQTLASIVRTAEEIVAAWPAGAFATLRLSAAGGGSPVMQRLRAELASALRLQAMDDPAHLQVAVRRGERPGTWQVLLRTAPRPLGARAWRVCDWPGALNGTAAYAMARLSEPRATDCFVNLCCGSGTLLIERQLLAPAATAWGCDTDPAALACAEANVAASGLASRVELHLVDACRLPFADGTVDAAVADLPFAMRIGSAAENRAQYPALLREAARVLGPGGRLVLISTQQRLLAGVLRDQTALWQPAPAPLTIELPFQHGRIQPGIRVLRRA